MKLIAPVSLIACIYISPFCFPKDSQSGEQGNFQIGQPGQGISYGLLTLHPFLNAEVEYDRNIYLVDKNAKDDFITTISPGVHLEFPWDSNLIRLTYRADILYYSHYSRLNNTRHFLEGLLNYRFYKHSLELYERFRHTDTRQDTEFAQRIKRNENRAGILVREFFNKYDIALGYENYLKHFITYGYRAYNYQKHSALAQGRYKISPKLRALLEYNYTYIDYDHLIENPYPDTGGNLRSNAYFNQLLVGIDGRITSKLSATAKVGYQVRNYKEEGKNDYDGSVGYLVVNQAFSPYSQLELGGKKTLSESTYTISNYYNIIWGWLRYEHQLSHKFRGALVFTYRNHRYPSPSSEGSSPERKRHDDIWRGTAELNYRLQPWLNLKLRYSYLTRNSNIPGLDYIDSRVAIILASHY